MRLLILLFFAIAAMFAQELPCKADEDRSNGSALCVQLRVLEGRVAVAATVFAPTKMFGADKAAGDGLGVEASRAIAQLDSPCLLAMTDDQRRRYRRKQLNDAKTLQVCQGSFENWQDYTRAFLDWAEQIGRKQVALNVLSEAGVFRPLRTLYLRSALLWDDERSLNAESGRIDFFLADRFDPKPGIIRIENSPDDQIRDRRTAELVRALNPLRGSVFCHQKIRAQILSYYAKRNLRPEAIVIDANGPLIVIRESGGSGQ